MVCKWFSEWADGRPTSRLPEQQPDLQALLAPESDTRVIWLGHSTFLLYVAGTIVLVDPVFSETAAPVGFTARRFQPTVLSLEMLPTIDIILISDETLWASWVMATPDSQLFSSGDSGYDTHFAEIGEPLGPFDLAVMENGQYDKAWLYVHMQPAEAIQAYEGVIASRLMPVHWRMFELAFHTWYTPGAALSQLADQEGIELVTPMLGELIIIDDPLKTTRWWERVVHADS